MFGRVSLEEPFRYDMDRLSKFSSVHFLTVRSYQTDQVGEFIGKIQAMDYDETFSLQGSLADQQGYVSCRCQKPGEPQPIFKMPRPST